MSIKSIKASPQSKISLLRGREILDSKGWPTIEVSLETSDFLVRASVPSGTSKGKYEALELRDDGKRYQGRGVLKAIANVNEIIAPKLIGRDPTKQEEIDHLMIEMDGTKNKSKLGANSIIGVSMAVCRAGAKAKNLPLYQYISEIYRGPSSVRFTEDGPLSPLSFQASGFRLPSPCFLLIEGGLHAGNDLDIQEFMITPEGDSFEEKLRVGVEIYHTLSEILEKKYGESSKNVGFEGGFAPSLEKSEEALDLVLEATEKTGYENKVKIVLDMAASSFFKNDIYKFEGNDFSKEQLLQLYQELFKKYPIFAIEDPFSEDDWQGWKTFMSKVNAQESKVLVIGDDLLVTNIERIKEAQEKKACNALILKPNQIGTITETIAAATLAKQNNWQIFVKHRSGETNDDFIADLAVGLGNGWIMAGAPVRGERMAKYNRLLEIEKAL